MKIKPLNILVSAYACGPKWGSEIGMGWNWVINLAQYCELTVITEIGFKEDIEEVLPTLNLKNPPIFYYIDVGDMGRKLFWKQGSFTFYKHYKIWQQKAYILSEKLIKLNKYDLIHQLNMIGYREPGFLWKNNEIPKVWGPIGGFTLMPWKFLYVLGFNNAVFYALKNVYNVMQMYYFSRIRNAVANFDTLISATEEAQINLYKLYKKNSIVINETGSKSEELAFEIKNNQKVKIIWCGIINGGKALPVALKSLAKISDKDNFEFNILGDGPDKNYCFDLAKKIGISDKCIWHGRVPNSEVIKQMKNADLFFFTSLVEGTPHVVLEAIASGLPVICHDSCGHGAVINDSCGRKIPIVSPKVSCDMFSEVIAGLITDRKKIEILSQGAIMRSKELRWENKAKQMVEIYRQTIIDNQKKIFKI
jgi:glycosyltransferase involved in cell wall biosynthesis